MVNVKEYQGPDFTFYLTHCKSDKYVDTSEDQLLSSLLNSCFFTE